jgi:hypothetical protein
MLSKITSPEGSGGERIKDSNVEKQELSVAQQIEDRLPISKEFLVIFRPHPLHEKGKWPQKYPQHERANMLARVERPQEPTEPYSLYLAYTSGRGYGSPKKNIITGVDSGLDGQVVAIWAKENKYESPQLYYTNISVKDKNTSVNPKNVEEYGE